MIGRQQYLNNSSISTCYNLEADGLQQQNILAGATPHQLKTEN